MPVALAIFSRETALSVAVESGTNRNPSAKPCSVRGQKMSQLPESWLVTPIHQQPAAKMSRPTVISSRPSMRATRREAMIMLTAVAIAPGSSASPVWVAVKPSTFCRKSGMISAVP
jgi:hypothetical protein